VVVAPPRGGGWGGGGGGGGGKRRIPFRLPLTPNPSTPNPLSLLLLAALAASASCHSDATPAAVPPSVTVAQPTTQPVAAYLDFTGNTAPTDSVTLVARVEGYLEKIHFTDGAQVKKGDLLFTIQQSQYKAQLQQAIASVEAQRAAVKHAETELARYSALVVEDSAPQTQVDRWKYERDASLAALYSAEGQVELAKLNLQYTEVRAPFDGRMGRHLIDIGNLVGGVGQPGNLAQIEKMDPLYVYFTIDERALLELRAQHRTDAGQPLNQRKIPAAFGLLDEDGYPHEGMLDFASLDVAPRTGTLQVRGVFPNPAPPILSGLFARVRIPLGAPRPAIVIPGDALSFDQQGEYVLVVNADDVVERRPVTTGQQIGEQYVVEQGLQTSDWVVVEGLARAIPGRKVAPQRGAVTPRPTPAAKS
jgi:RND family efflux transporter MFP subunit